MLLDNKTFTQNKICVWKIHKSLQQDLACHCFFKLIWIELIPILFKTAIKLQLVNQKLQNQSKCLVIS